jgi:uncharacterized integral membrane protein
MPVLFPSEEESRHDAIMDTGKTMKLKSALLLIPVLLFLIFVLQNTQVVEVKFIAWTVSMSRALLLLGTLVVGLVLGWLFKALTSRKARSSTP